MSEAVLPDDVPGALYVFKARCAPSRSKTGSISLGRAEALAGTLDPVDREDVIARVKERCEGLTAREPSVAAVYVFGSVARGTARPDSDLDVGVVFVRGTGAGTRDRIADALGVALGAATGIERVDVVDLEAQGPIFAHRVLCEGALAHEGDRARRVDFESDTVVRALDFRPTYELATRGKATALRRWLRERYDLRSGSVEARPPEG